MQKDCKPQILYVLGGPGSGKRTQCLKLVRDFKFKHISMGQLFRTEVKSGSELGTKLNDIMNKGDLVPTNLTYDLLFNAIEKNKCHKKLIIDGFPRSVE
jgi:adenylate kinase family enzyme